MRDLNGTLVGFVFILATQGCSLRELDPVNQGHAGNAGNSNGTAGASGSPASGGRSSRGGASSSSTPAASGGTANGGASAIGGSTSAGGTTSTGGTTSPNSSAIGGATNTGGTAGIGGTASAGGSTSVGGASAKGGSTSIGGTTAAGGTTGVGGASAKGGSTTIGGTTAAGGTTSMVTTATGDTTPPQIVSVTPSNGAAGVTATAKIVITFSEPMNTTSVTNALAVPPLATAALGQQWSSNNTVLSITPTAGFAYAIGTTAAGTTAQPFTVNIGTSAKDVAGNPLVAAYSSGFTTLKRITQTVTPDAVAHWDTYSKALSVGGPVSCSGGETIDVGFLRSPGGVSTFYGFAAWNLSGVASPITGASIESATIRASQLTPTANFYPNGSITLERLDFQSIDNTILDGVPTATLGTLSANSTAQSSLDVTAATVNDFAANQLKFLYRIAASGAPDNEYAYFYCGQFTLRLVFVTP